MCEPGQGSGQSPHVRSLQPRMVGAKGIHCDIQNRERSYNPREVSGPQAVYEGQANSGPVLISSLQLGCQKAATPSHHADKIAHVVRVDERGEDQVGDVQALQSFQGQLEH